MLTDYKKNEKIWAYISGKIPTKLVKCYKDTGMVHVESKRIHNPNYRELQKLIGDEIFDWSQNYAVHLWQRLLRKSKFRENVPIVDENTIKIMDNSSFGQLQE